MHKLKALFVVPQFTVKGGAYEFPVGLAYISSIVKEVLGEENVDVLNANHFLEAQEVLLKNTLEECNYDLVFTGGMSAHWALIEDILNHTHKYSPKSLVILGGAIISSDIELALRNLRFTFGVFGEGEDTVKELLHRLYQYGSKEEIIENIGDFDSIKGLTFMKGESIIIGEKRNPIDCLSNIPFPDYSGFGFNEHLEAYGQSTSNMYYSSLDEARVGSVLTSRSCPYNCSFCYHPLGNKYRQRDLDDVFVEIDYLINEYKVNVINVLDELFSLDKDRMYEFARRIGPYNIKWIAQFRVTDVDESVLRVMKAAGLYIVSYGIESMDNSILKSMNKGITVEDIESALRITKLVGIGIQGNIILGDIEETKETYSNSLSWFMKHPEYGLNLGIILTIPDSIIFRYAVEKGIIDDKLGHIKNGFPYVNITKMTDLEYFNMVSLVKRFNEDFTLCGKRYYLYGEKMDQTFISKFSKLVSIQCPHCNSVEQYIIKYTPSNQINIFCKNCLVRFKFETEQILSYRKRLSIKLVRRAKKQVEQLARRGVVNNKVLTRLKRIYIRYFMANSRG